MNTYSVKFAFRLLIAIDKQGKRIYKYLYTCTEIKDNGKLCVEMFMDAITLFCKRENEVKLTYIN